MRDRAQILTGLALFLALVTFPAWYGRKSAPPKLRLPAQAKQCVAPVSYMKTSHMTLLLQWRDEAVRRGNRTYRSYDGKTYEISLSNTCLNQCHTSKAEFCDRCHTYAGVQQPYCFDCHNDPTRQTMRASR
jgi:hypothetical protein